MEKPKYLSPLDTSQISKSYSSEIHYIIGSSMWMNEREDFLELSDILVATEKN